MRCLFRCHSQHRAIQQTPADSDEHLPKDRFLARKVPVDRRTGDADLSAEIVDRDTVEPRRRKQSGGGREDLSTTVLSRRHLGPSSTLQKGAGSHASIPGRAPIGSPVIIGVRRPGDLCVGPSFGGPLTGYRRFPLPTARAGGAISGPACRASRPPLHGRTVRRKVNAR